MESIAAVAMDLFERDGFDATNVETIALAAGCSIRTFYRYFGAKEDVVFYDRAESLDELGRELGEFLEDGLDAWQAVTETYTNLIARFDQKDLDIPIRRMRLCLREPALWTPYLRYAYEAEQVVAERLHRYRGTSPDTDNYPQLIAVAATGAYRVTLFTHISAGSDGNLAEQLGASLAAFESGLKTEITGRTVE